MRNRAGPSTEPCGTPESTGAEVYLYSFVFLFVGKIALMANVCMFILNADVK